MKKKKIIFDLLACVIMSIVCYSLLQLEPTKANLFLSFMGGGLLTGFYATLRIFLEIKQP